MVTLSHGLLFILLLVACQPASRVSNPPTVDIYKILAATAVPLIGPPAEPVTAVTFGPLLSGGFSGGLRKPVYLTHAGDARLFVAEQDGRVRIIENGELLPEPFLDVSALLATDGSERGLLGLAFHPQYAQNGYFYIVYTNQNGDTEITRYTVSEADPNRADANTAQRLFLIDQPYGNHNGGQLAFGPDGYFYIGLGDGGAVGDPYDNAQDPGTLLGSILRIDIDSSTPYAIPQDNPFVDERQARGEVWMIGLRNPWAFSFDRLTGDLYITDVAQDGLEEINFHPAHSPAGVNFGWPYQEGSDCYDAESCDIPGLRMPVYEYVHGEDGCAIIGGHVYRGSQFPALAGNYFFSDFCSGRIWTLHYDDGAGRWLRTAVAETNTQVSSIGVDAAGELYVVDYRTGAVWQIQAPKQD
ncbi:MAG TPA: PQQ-dependent sugar dehydrogenase [Chloroflexota bacterium]|nr:PQQ-dependent sugar dehydrogenase [Chloroflexota bacterium]HUM69508.1 PQQ-dependent sugar dehydrogenase [Chloroflexota bacterium]